MSPLHVGIMWAEEELLGSSFSDFYVIIFFWKDRPQSEGSRHAHLGIKLSPVSPKKVKVFPKQYRKRALMKTNADASYKLNPKSEIITRVHQSKKSVELNRVPPAK